MAAVIINRKPKFLIWNYFDYQKQDGGFFNLKMHFYETPVTWLDTGIVAILRHLFVAGC